MLNPHLPHQVSHAASSTLDFAQEPQKKKQALTDDLDWDCINLEKLLSYLCSESPAFAETLAQIAASSLGRLSLVLYCDGITPGSALTPDNKRKCVA